MIELKNVNKLYGNEKNSFQVLYDINLTVDDGIFMVILGASGSGKTTLLNVISGLEKVDKIVVSLDTIAHGGLVPSRRSLDSFEEIKDRMLSVKNILTEKNAKVYAFSSIMSISNNNINEEEKEYWNLYGEKIFKYSFDYHKNGEAKTDVPDEIVDDYLNTRKRNFEINKLYLEWAKENFFETLVFSKDDCAQYGFNVKEAQELSCIIKKENLNALVKTGSDEIPLSLLSRALTNGKSLKIAPIFTEPKWVDKISKYEDVSVYESVKGQIELAGGRIVDEAEADMILLVNNFKEEQGELVMGVDVEGFCGNLQLPLDKPYLIADIRNANGADNSFVKCLFEKDFISDKFLGYAAWNTTGNTLGSGLCCAIVKYFAKNVKECAFKKVQAVRFLDDWAYQANVRKVLKSYLKTIDVEELKSKMSDYEIVVNKKLDTNYTNISYGYPWDRFFEIEVEPN